MQDHIVFKECFVLMMFGDVWMIGTRSVNQRDADENADVFE